MSSEYEIRLLKQGEENKLLELLNQSYKGWPHFDLQCTPMEHWRWKNIDDPFGESRVIVADHGGDLVGCIHLCMNSLKIGSKTYLSVQSSDAAVLQDHREFGVFTKIRTVSEAYSNPEMGVRYGVTSNPYVAKTVFKADPLRIPIPLSFMIKINDIGSYTQSLSMTKKLLVTSGYRGAELLNSLRNPLKTTNEEHVSNLEIHEIKEFDSRIDEFWEEIKESYSLIQTLTRQYLNWRFCDLRGGSYIIRQAEEDGKVTGFSVLRINRYGAVPASGYIVALYCLPGKLNHTKVLLEDALYYFQEQGINTMKYCVNRGNPYEEIFKERGFVVAPGESNFNVIARNIGDDYEELKKSSSKEILFQYNSFDWI